MSVTVQLSTTVRTHPYPPESFESTLDALSHLDGGFSFEKSRQQRSDIQGCCSLDVAKISVIMKVFLELVSRVSVQCL